jgi:hypothetical protein
MQTQAHELAEQIRRNRMTGETRVYIEVVPQDKLPAPEDHANVLMQQLRFRRSNGWEHLDRRASEVLIQTILYRDLAYRKANMDIQLAVKFKDQFFEFFQRDGIYLTNAEFTIEHDATSGFALADISALESLTDATFDTGIICRDAHHIGLLWVQDED